MDNLDGDDVDKKVLLKDRGRRVIAIYDKKSYKSESFPVIYKNNIKIIDQYHLHRNNSVLIVPQHPFKNSLHEKILIDVYLVENVNFIDHFWVLTKERFSNLISIYLFTFPIRINNVETYKKLLLEDNSRIVQEIPYIPDKIPKTMIEPKNLNYVLQSHVLRHLQLYSEMFYFSSFPEILDGIILAGEYNRIQTFASNPNNNLKSKIELSYMKSSIPLLDYFTVLLSMLSNQLILKNGNQRKDFVGGKKIIVVFNTEGFNEYILSNNRPSNDTEAERQSLNVYDLLKKSIADVIVDDYHSLETRFLGINKEEKKDIIEDNEQLYYKNTSKFIKQYFLFRLKKEIKDELEILFLKKSHASIVTSGYYINTDYINKLNDRYFKIVKELEEDRLSFNLSLKRNIPSQFFSLFRGIKPRDLSNIQNNLSYSTISKEGKEIYEKSLISFSLYDMFLFMGKFILGLKGINRIQFSGYYSKQYNDSKSNIIILPKKYKNIEMASKNHEFVCNLLYSCLRWYFMYNETSKPRTGIYERKEIIIFISLGLLLKKFGIQQLGYNFWCRELGLRTQDGSIEKVKKDNPIYKSFSLVEETTDVSSIEKGIIYFKMKGLIYKIQVYRKLKEIEYNKVVRRLDDYETIFLQSKKVYDGFLLYVQNENEFNNHLSKDEKQRIPYFIEEDFLIERAEYLYDLYHQDTNKVKFNGAMKQLSKKIHETGLKA